MDSTRLATQTFAQSLFVGLRAVEGCSLPVPAELSYNTSDPYALTISFFLDETPVPWTFGRDLLSGGLIEPTGDGDVHVWPCLDDEGAAVVTIELCSPHGDALVELRTEDAADFVERAHALVAPGAESAHLDVDAAITAIRAAENA
jgi:hypothetical protein